MNTNQLINALALAFAGFAAFQLLKPKAGNALLPSQPGQRQRDDAVTAWFSNLTAQQAQVIDKSLGQYNDELRRLNIL